MNFFHILFLATLGATVSYLKVYSRHRRPRPRTSISAQDVLRFFKFLRQVYEVYLDKSKKKCVGVWRSNEC